MRNHFLLPSLLAALLTLSSAARVTNPSKVPRNAVLLSKISTLTLRSGKKTSSRRVSPVPQLQCVGPSSVCALYSVDVMRCRNEGADYDVNDAQWTCVASLPEEFKLGSTDVSCEGYESSQDPYVLKGSCGVKYRLLLTDKGEARYGSQGDDDIWNSFRSKTGVEKFFNYAFWLVFVVMTSAIVLSALGCFGRRGQGGPRGNRLGWGGDGGGGGGGPDGQPPPYGSWGPGKYTRTDSAQPQQQQGQAGAWRPGFWTGAGLGAGAAYLMRNRGQNQTPTRNQGYGYGGMRSDPGEGSSRPSSSPSSSSHYRSTGFGSTSRR